VLTFGNLTEKLGVKGGLTGLIFFWFACSVLFFCFVTNTVKVNPKYAKYVDCFCLVFLLMTVFYAYIVSLPVYSYGRTKLGLLERVRDMHLTPDEVIKMHESYRSSDELK